jgi:peptidoglycan/xylan/chitin deacetylase (PgdA/CDA1 family)
MKLFTAGLIATIIVIIFGVVIIAPIFDRAAMKAEPLKVVLLLSVRSENSTDWCEDVGSYLDSKGIHATVFLTGAAADENLDLVSAFKVGVDIGSMTYEYVNLTSIPDYSEQLDQIIDAKTAVDSTGGLTSRVFMAPYGSVNGDIYSQLNRAGIVADFSYSDHYNKIYDGQFIRMDLQVFDYHKHTPRFYLSITNKQSPVAIRIDDSINSTEVTNFISQLASGNVQFINASELTGIRLTTRG